MVQPLLSAHSQLPNVARLRDGLACPPLAEPVPRSTCPNAGGICASTFSAQLCFRGSGVLHRLRPAPGVGPPIGETPGLQYHLHPRALPLMPSVPRPCLCVPSAWSQSLRGVACHWTHKRLPRRSEEPPRTQGSRASHLGAVLRVGAQINLRSSKAAVAVPQARCSGGPTAGALAAAVAPRYGPESRRADHAGPHQGDHGHAALSTLDHLLADHL